MKTLPILLIILFAVNQEVTAENFYKKGDTLNVWAVSGLNMREGPGTDFPKIKKLEYGEQVEVIDENLRSTPLNLTIIKKHGKNAGFVLEGYWVRVKTGTQEGYVFDGYLSRLPVLKIQKSDGEGKKTDWICEELSSYVKREFEFLKEEKEVVSDDGIEDISYYSNDVSYANGGNEGCGFSEFRINNFSKNEGYLIFNVVFQVETYFQKKSSKDEKGYESIYIFNKEKETTIALNFEPEGTSYEFYFYFNNGKVIIGSMGCC